LLGRGALSEFMSAAESGGEHVTLETPFFYPERFGEAGAWSGRAGLQQGAYATLEGISFTLRQLVVEDMACSPAKELTATGGGSASRVWLQLIADVVGCPVSRGTGDSLLGAARMALGRAAAEDARVAATYRPRRSRAARLAERYRLWLAGQRTGGTR
jgi:sugar (pentulose or hexulose) kinase